MSEFITNGELRLAAERLDEECLALRELCVRAYKMLDRAYRQPTGFVVHGGIDSGEMAALYEGMRKLGIEVGQ